MLTIVEFEGPPEQYTKVYHTFGTKPVGGAIKIGTDILAMLNVQLAPTVTGLPKPRDKMSRLVPLDGQGNPSNVALNASGEDGVAAYELSL